jgi:arylsulfatase A-like enzyme
VIGCNFKHWIDKAGSILPPQRRRMILYFGYLVLPVVLAPIVSSVLWNAIAFEILFAAIVSCCLAAAGQGFRRPWMRFLAAFLPAVFIFFFEFLQLISYSLQGESFNERFFFHMQLSSLIVGARAYSWMAITPMLATLIAGAMDVLLSRKIAARQSTKRTLVAGSLFLLAMLLPVNAPNRFVVEYLKEMFSKRSGNLDEIKAELKKRGVNISAFSNQNIKAECQPSSRNLVLIYMESLESSYLNEDQFPGLVPNIKAAMAEGMEFNNLSQYSGTNWTLAGMFASQFGMPLGVKGNDSIYQNQALANMAGLGDILNEAGYYQAFMGGADLSFSGKNRFYTDHGYREALGYKELKPMVSDQSYETGWGLYDDTLFDLAAQKLKELTKKHEKVNLTLLTLDTHHPKGDASKSCPAYSQSSNSMLQAVHCTDYLLGKFLNTLKQTDCYNKTLIFVMSDHLAMENVAQPLYRGERKLTAFALNAGTEKIDIAGAHFDIAPTILDLLQIKTNAQFPLGQSLLKPEQPNRYAVFQNDGYELMKDFLEEEAKQAEPINICSGDGIRVRNAQDFTIYIGGHPIVMSLDGWPMYPEDYIFMVRCNLDGQMQRYRMVTEQEAAKVVETYPDALYFMLTKNARIPHGLGPENANDNWKAYLGNPSTLTGIIGETPQISQAAVDAEVCRKTLKNSRQGSPQIFSLRSRNQHLYENLQTARRQAATAYEHFYPEKIDLVSSSIDGNESHILLDDMPLKATKGITLAAIDSSINGVIHHRSYNISDSPQAASALLNDLSNLNNNRVVLITFQGKLTLPVAIIRAFEKLGAKEIQNFSTGQPYILIAKVGKPIVFEATGAPGTIINKTLSVYDNEAISSIRQLWGDSPIIIQSASYAAGRSYGIIDNVEVPNIGRGLNVLILNSATKAIKLNNNFDTYADANAMKKLSHILREAKLNEIVIVFADDTPTGGSELPEYLKADLKRLGAVFADEVKFRTPYIFLTKVGSDFHIEKCSSNEGVLRVEITPSVAGKLFPTAAHALASESLHLIDQLVPKRGGDKAGLEQAVR